MTRTHSESQDIASLNENILQIDLDDLEIDVMEQRVELTLASLFGDNFQNPPDQQCGTFVCSGYMPVR